MSGRLCGSARGQLAPWTEADEHSPPGDEREFKEQVKRRISNLRADERKEINRRRNAVAFVPTHVSTSLQAERGDDDVREEVAVIAAAAATAGLECLKADDGGEKVYSSHA